jgi:hypothetical protein
MCGWFKKILKTPSHYIRRLMDAYRDTIRVTTHYDLIKLNGGFISFKIFIIRFFYSFPFIRNFKRIAYENKKIDTSFFIQKKLDLFKDVQQIDQLGYSKNYNIDNSLSKKILNLILTCKDLDFKKIDLPRSEILKKEDEKLEDYFLRLKEKKISRIVGNLNLKDNSFLKEFLTSKGILTLVKNYLNTKIVSVNATFFISNPVDTNEKEKYSNAQYFHWDNDFKKFLKLYVYLTDVDIDSGPHVFAEKSHRYKKKEHRLCRLFKDDDIYKSYKKVKEFTGKAGSAFFVDSYGLHKANPPKKKSRIMLNVHFGSGKILYSPNDLILNLK